MRKILICSYCALCAALLAVCSQIVIPLPIIIPINFALFAVWMTGALLGWNYGGISVLVYILLGAVGVPVFAGLKGGIGALVGPTGGYIVGYLIGVVACGLIIGRGRHQFVRYPIAMVIGCALCYLFGTAWYMISAHMALVPALVACVFPFLPGDAIKIALASVLSYRLNKSGVIRLEAK